MQVPGDGNRPAGSILLFLIHRLFLHGFGCCLFLLEILIQSQHSFEIVQLCHGFIRLLVYALTQLLVYSNAHLRFYSFTLLLIYAPAHLRVYAFAILRKCNYNFAYRKQLFCVSKKYFAIFATQTKGVKVFDLRGKLRDGRSCHEREARSPVHLVRPRRTGLAPESLAFGLRPFSVRGDRTVSKIRKHYVNVRFSDNEFEKLNAQMILEGYRNRSKYIRETLLVKRIQRRNFRRTEANITKQLALLKAEIVRIGNNYNQKVKALNTLAKLRDKSGRPVVTAGMVRTDLADMKAMMNEILEKVRLVEEDVQ